LDDHSLHTSWNTPRPQTHHPPQPPPSPATTLPSRQSPPVTLHP
jgi:hypothetical protein